MTNNSFTFLYNPIITPAYCAEEIAFNPESQPKNAALREVLARVVAVAAPFFFGFQVCLYAVAASIDLLLVSITILTLGLISLTPGIIFQIGFQSCAISIKCLFSSVIEMPQKLASGPKNAPNYYGPSDRYNMLHHRFDLI